MEEIIYFNINNWFRGRDYPPVEPFDTWVNLNSPLDDGAWCKENKICVKTGYIDMSRNWCVSAPRSFVEKYCPQLLTNEEYTYDICTFSNDGNTVTTHTKKYSDFVCTPDKDRDVEGRFGWTFLDYKEENFGVTWYEESFEDYDDEDDDDRNDDDVDCYCE